MKLLAARILFFCARVFQSRGKPLGQWFQNQGVLLLAGVKAKRD
jgi:hypothetical protein